jgi:apolipoprotein N-acyltransferase
VQQRTAVTLARSATVPAWFSSWSGWRRVATAFAAGAALTLSQPPLPLWPVLFAAWPVLFWQARGVSAPRGAAVIGWWAGLGFFLSGLYWIGSAFLVEATKVWWYLPLMPLAIGALAAFLALFWAAAFAAAVRIGLSGWRGPLALAVTLSVAEALRGSVLTGFPWALQAYAWVDTPVIQGTALIGSYALSGLTMLAALTLGLWHWRAAALTAGALALAWVWGAHRIPETPQPAGPVIRLVQPAIDQRDKWRPENTAPIFRQLLDLTARPAAVQPSLVVWPEVAVTFLFDTSPDAIKAATDAIPGGAVLAVGSVRAEPGTPRRRLFNSLLFYDSDGNRIGSYDKRKLAPFGEYVPYASVLGWLGLGTLGDGLSGFSPGIETGPFILPGLPPAVALICYEIIFPGLTRETAATGDWILQVTNDAWFGKSAGPYQHLAQARVRAIETGLPVARAANTGISAIIDPYGRLTATLPLGRSGVLDAALPHRIGAPLHALWGNAPGIAALSVAIALLVLTGARGR